MSLIDNPKSVHECRVCQHPELEPILDLGAVLVGDLLESTPQTTPVTAPLKLVACTHCTLLQLETHLPPQAIYNERYPYFSSQISALVDYATHRAETLINDYHLDAHTQVLEVASNDGYFLEAFARHGVGVLGIEPCAPQAARAADRGVQTKAGFFTSELAREVLAQHGTFDLILANNVLAHSPNPTDLLKGIALCLADDTHAIIEVHDADALISGGQFDTVYHQHICYFDTQTLSQTAELAGLDVVRIEPISQYGGSLRATLRKQQSDGVKSEPITQQPAQNRIRDLRQWGANMARTIDAFTTRINQKAKSGKRVVGYGAAAKAATLISVCDLAHCIDYVVDNNKDKVGRYMPGTAIPIFGTSKLRTDTPDVVIIFAWNYADEIRQELGWMQALGTEIIVPHQ